MKRKYFIYLLIICAFSAACGKAKIENAAPDSSVGKHNLNAAIDSDKNAVAQTGETTNVNANPAANTAEEKEFTGTAGITDKKNETKTTVVLKDIRAAAHENYDRVVFEFAGAEMPSYHIEYIDKPVRACGSGEVVPLRGDGWLEIRFSPAAAHSEDGKPTVKNLAQSPDLKIIREMKSTCDFEAEVEWVLGVAAPNKYRVTELKNPTRLALDLKH